MTYSRPTLAELDTRIQADLAQMPGVLREALSHAWARACHGLHGHLEWIDAQNNPLTCELDRLYDWAALYNVPRLSATAAIGDVIVTGTPGSTIYADTLARATNGLDYRVLETRNVQGSGSVTVRVRSETQGSSTNLPAGASLTLIDPLSGIASTLTVDEAGLSGGAAEETLDDYRVRVVDEWQAMTMRGARGGRIEDYKYWCQSAHPAVSGALIFPHALGLGTVAVHPICNNEPDRMPSPAVLETIAAFLRTVAPATADWKLSPPAPRPVEVSLSLDATIDNALTRNRIFDAIRNAIFAETQENAILRLSEIDAAISTVTNQYIRFSPTQDIEVYPGEVFVASEITWL